MIVFILLIVVVLIGLTTAAVMGRIGGFMAEPVSSQAFDGIPDGLLSPEYIRGLHIDQALRGYRMDQVDDVFDLLSARLGDLEAELASLRTTGAAGPERKNEP